MNPTPAAGPSLDIRARPVSSRRPVLLVFGCTLLGAGAQILMKTGAGSLAHPTLAAVLTNLPLITGYALYGLSTILLVLALRDGELSLLYPVIALTYVWVTVLSYALFHERMNPYKLLGIGIIVGGVAVLGRGSRR